jgi:hypothetical protein
MIFQLPEGTRLSERVEARNRLLQAYDEEVTILRTFPRTFLERRLPNCRGKIDDCRLRQGYGKPRDSRLSCRLSETPALRRRCWLRRGRRRRSRRRLNWRTCWRRNGRSLRCCRGGRSSRSSLRFHQLAPKRALSTSAPMRIQNRQRKREREENASEPGRKLHQHVRRLRAENVLRDRSPKCRSQAFALWALHQDHEHHEKGHQNKKHRQQVDEKIHRGGKYER